ncbi:MAG: glycosyltransferase, partial [Halioglobus sp.]|nr:glycosyltransferase [Halioglobus sp.]
MPAGSAQDDEAPLVVHVVHRFDYGGLENGLVNIINTMDDSAYRHAIIALTEATDFAQRIRRKNTAVYSLGKRPGKDLRAYLRLWSLLHRLKPAVLHTRNMGTLDCALVGRLAGIRVCVHGEHGWDTHDPDGTVRKYRILRKFMGLFVARFITVSEHLARWLINSVGIPAGKVTAICNGVDTDKFCPAATPARSLLPAQFRGDRTVVIGTVSRFEAIKDPLNLVRAFISAHAVCEKNGVSLRLAM